MWAAGCIFAEMLTGKTLFAGIKHCLCVTVFCLIVLVLGDYLLLSCTHNDQVVEGLFLWPCIKINQDNLFFVFVFFLSCVVVKREELFL